MTDEDFDFDALLGTVPEPENDQTEEAPKPAPKKTMNITEAQKEARRLNAIKASGIAAEKRKAKKQAQLATEAKTMPQSKPINIPKREVSDNEDDDDEELVINEPEEKPPKKSAYELQLEKQMEELRAHTSQIEAKMKKEKKNVMNVNINHPTTPVIQKTGEAAVARKKVLMNF